MRTLAILLTVVAVACSGPAVQQSPVQPAAGAGDAGAATITPTDVYARIAFLASDALRGRDTPSQGLESAAAYIASEYMRLGLQPRGDSGTYVQRYPFPIRTLRTDSARLDVTVRGQSTHLMFGSDMFLSAGTPARAQGDLVFAGTRLDTTTTGALRGNLPVVFMGGTMDRTWRAAVTGARMAAKTAGANGLIVVLDPAVGAEQMQQGSRLFSNIRNASAASSVGFIRYDRARDLFRQSGADLDRLVASAAGASFQPVPLKASTAELTTSVAEVVHYPPNVVAVLEGSDPELKNTYVVLSAHMDHIGVTAPDARGDSINNGADDDASGTTAVVEAAEALAALRQRPLRSILFLNVSGEEKGLVGSKYFSEHPTVPLGSIVADINIDMIGRNAADTVVAIGQDYSSLGPLTQEVARNHPELHLTASRDIWPQERFFFRSDHFNFAAKEIPAIFFFSGVHEDYHRPSDEVQKINTDKAARIAKLAYYLALEIANRREAPRWTEQGLKEVRALTR